METQASQPLNPWLSIWFRPRATIRYIISTDPTYRVYSLAALGGISKVLDRAMSRAWGDSMAWYWIVLLVLVGGPVAGVFGLYIGGAIFRWVGSKLGGAATSEEVRAAIAWASLPGIAGLVFIIPYLIFLRSEAFTSETPRLDAIVAQSPAWAILVSLLGIYLIVIGVVLSLWQLVLLSKTLGEVHGFSAWRGFLTYFIPSFVFFILLFVIFVLPRAIYMGP